METQLNILKILNESGVRKTLAKNIPLVDRIENSDCLKDLTLTKLSIESRGQGISITYDAVAKKEIWPSPRAKLIKKEVFKKSEVTAISEYHRGSDPRIYTQISLQTPVTKYNALVYLNICQPDEI